MIFRKLFALLILVCSNQIASAQTDTAHFYTDFYDQPVLMEDAIHHVKVFKEKPDDAYWKMETYYHSNNRLISIGRSKNDKTPEKHGYFTLYHSDGSKQKAGHYVDNEVDGEWTSWYEGKVTGVNNFSRGKRTGSNVSTYNTGEPQDSFMLDRNGNGPGAGYYKSGNLRYKGPFVEGKKSGHWDYYYDVPGYTKSMEIVFTADSLTTSTCYTVKGSIQTGECIHEREAYFAGGDLAWKNYLVANLSDGNWVKHMKKRTLYQSMVLFIVNKNGTVEEIRVERPRIKQLDKLAIKIIEDSPKWVPAIQYNQPVNAYRRQPITFMVSEEE